MSKDSIADRLEVYVDRNHPAFYRIMNLIMQILQEDRKEWASSCPLTHYLEHPVFEEPPDYNLLTDAQLERIKMRKREHEDRR